VPKSVGFDRVAGSYDETRGGEERGRRVAEFVAPHLPAGRLLEIGVGTGLVATAFQARGWAVTGVDISPAMLAHAQRRIPGRLVVADAHELPCSDGSMDACIAVHVLHLVGDVRRTLGEVARVLRPGGRFAVLAPADAPAGSDVARLTQSMGRALQAGRNRPDQVAVLVPIAAAVGLQPAEELVLTLPGRAVTPKLAREEIEARLWSSLWDLPESRWAEIVEPTIRALRRLPDQEVPRAGVLTISALVFENRR
jgi:SAM-dependent methyltransferase